MIEDLDCGYCVKLAIWTLVILAQKNCLFAKHDPKGSDIRKVTSLDNMASRVCWTSSSETRQPRAADCVYFL